MIDLNNEDEYKKQIDFIKSIINKTKDKDKLREFEYSVRIGNLKTEDKAFFFDEIEYKITGRRHTDIEILKDIEESRADISDIN